MNVFFLVPLRVQEKSQSFVVQMIAIFVYVTALKGCYTGFKLT